MRHFIPALIACAIPVTASSESASMLAEGGNSALVYNITAVKIELSDEVTDGCLPQPQSVRRSAEAALRRNDFAVKTEDDDFLTPTVQIAAVGYDIGDNATCAVMFSLSLEKYVVTRVPNTNNLESSMQRTIALASWEIYQTLLTGSRNDMQQRIEREAEKAADELFISIDRARDYVKDKWPEVWSAAYGRT